MISHLVGFMFVMPANPACPRIELIVPAGQTLDFLDSHMAHMAEDACAAKFTQTRPCAKTVLRRANRSYKSICVPMNPPDFLDEGSI